MPRGRSIKKIIQILEYINSNPNRAYNTAIAKALGKTRATMSYQLNQLEKEGLIYSIPTGKRKLYRLTDKGKEFLNRILDQKSIQQKLEKKKNVRKKGKMTRGHRAAGREKGDNKEDLKKFLPGFVRVHNVKVKLHVKLRGEEAFGLAENRDVNLILKYYLGDNYYTVIKRTWEAVFFEFPLELEDVEGKIEGTTQSIILHFRAKDFSYEDLATRGIGIIYNWANKAAWKIAKWIELHTPLEITDIEVIHQEIANQVSPFWDKVLPAKLNVSLELLDKALSTIFGPVSKQRIKLWLERSFGWAELETSSSDIEDYFLRMPINVHYTLLLNAAILAGLEKQSKNNLGYLNGILGILTMQSKILREIKDKLDPVNNTNNNINVDLPDDRDLFT